MADTIAQHVAPANQAAPAPGGLQHQHVLDLNDWNKEDIDLVLRTADGMREVLQRDIKKVPTLRGKTVITLFYEASTRTRMSFELAGKLLSADVINLTASTSSTTKGESLVDTVKTIDAMAPDCIVMRHPSSGAPYLVAQQVHRSRSMTRRPISSPFHPSK